MNELKTTISQMRNSSPGPDGVFYQMLKRVPDKVKEYVLKIMNKFWMESYFPDCWCEAVIVAFPKPGKDHRILYS